MGKDTEEPITHERGDISLTIDHTARGARLRWYWQGRLVRVVVVSEEQYDLLVDVLVATFRE